MEKYAGVGFYKFPAQETCALCGTDSLIKNVCGTDSLIKNGFAERIV